MLRKAKSIWSWLHFWWTKETPNYARKTVRWTDRDGVPPVNFGDDDDAWRDSR